MFKNLLNNLKILKLSNKRSDKLKKYREMRKDVNTLFPVLLSAGVIFPSARAAKSLEEYRYCSFCGITCHKKDR